MNYAHIACIVFRIIHLELCKKMFQNESALLCLYTPGEPNPDLAKNMLLLKNPQFLPNHCETLSK